jgi:hypothetical protein
VNTALALFNLQKRWFGAIEAAREAAKFVAVDQHDELAALGDDVDWIASRARAVEIQKQLPPLTEIEAAYKAVDQTLRVRPQPIDYQLLASKMLDVIGIRGGDDADAYVEAMAWSLGDVYRANWEDSDTPDWIPVPAFALAVKRTLEDRDAWDHYGGTKRPPIPGIVDRCRDYRSDLVNMRHSIAMLDRTQKRLGWIIETVNNYETEEW